MIDASNETKVKIIRPKMGAFDLGLGEIWSFRELLYFLVWKDIKVRYKQTVVGAAWAMVQPLFSMVVFTFLLGNLAKVDTEGFPYPIYAYTGLVLWVYFSNSVSISANSLITNSNLVSKVYFPRALIPTGTCIVGLLDFAIASAILIIFVIYYQVQVTIMIVLFFVPIVMAFVLALGLSFWLSAVNVKYRDVVFIVPFFIQILLFATPILYASSMLPASLEWTLYINPLAGIFSLQRGVFLGTSIDWLMVGCSAVITILIFIGGLVYFRRYEKDFADVI